MTERILTNIGGVFLLIVILGIIPYGIWIIHSLFKRRWRSAGIRLAIPLVLYACLIAANAFLGDKIASDRLTSIFNVELELSELGSAVLKYDSDRSFNGDGYSISVYPLPAAIRQRFEGADEKLLTEHPQLPISRKHWRVQPWRATPFDDQFKKQLDLALNPVDSPQVAGLEARLEGVRSALRRPGTYYAIFYYSNGSYVGDVEFFLVDLVGGLLYVINHNT